MDFNKPTLYRLPHTLCDVATVRRAHGSIQNNRYFIFHNDDSFLKIKPNKRTSMLCSFFIKKNEKNEMLQDVILICRIHTHTHE